jgi:1-acyl-sn-glycerol-3-phosphate acyltransferase
MKNFLLLHLINQCLKHFIYKQFLILQFLFLKKELLLIPIFGWYLKKIGSISIKRNKITKDNLGFFEDILK